MEGGRATDKLRHLIGNWNELGTTDEHLNSRETINRDACSHLLDRFHSQDAASGQRQKLGELSRAGAKIDDGAGGGKVGEQCSGIFGPPRNVLAHFACIACGNRRGHGSMSRAERIGRISTWQT